MFATPLEKKSVVGKVKVLYYAKCFATEAYA